jgi:hypothetical protein
MPPHPPLHALLAGLVDYAGLFPPAARGMTDAVREYTAHRAGPHAWMLGRFVLPVARLAEFEAAAETHLGRDPGDPWRLSVLAAPDLADAVLRIGEFNCRHAAPGARAAVADVVELKAATTVEIERAAKLPSWLVPYVEIPLADDPAPLVDALARAGLRAKVRTGGVTADAFPTLAQLARFVVRCARAGVPFKATAGLHHPLRGEFRLTYEPGAPHGTMFGFLNVFLAAALARAGADEADVAALLEERDPRALAVADDALAWRGHRFTADALREARTSAALAFGSCSFAEPVDDLRALGLL